MKATNQRILIEATLVAMVLFLFLTTLWSFARADVLTKHCADFKSQKEAQSAYEWGNTSLDGDNDGQACETYAY